MKGCNTLSIELKVKRNNGKIWSHIRNKWLYETPEERVRQEYLCVLVNQYGYSLDQIAEEEVVDGRGSGAARADFLIWRSTQERHNKNTAFIVVECKSDNVTIDAKTYTQGANYAQYERAKFFVTHNNRETKYWKVDLARRMPNFDEIENIPHNDASDKEIEKLITKLKAFKEDEFADLLHQCHNVIRNREKLDPASAFDEIAKVLFVKVWVERELRRKRQRLNLFTADWLDGQVSDNPLDWLFQETKKFYKADNLFKEDEKIGLKYATGREIVRLLERYNLSDTSEDIKGIAFERFLGRTFRGEIGQFFTPRTIVEFMVRMVDPKEGEIICDPASGSGGFLIRVFELIREKILADADKEYNNYKIDIERRTDLSDLEKSEKLISKYEKVQKELDASTKDSRLWNLSNNYIYGTDANERMARTSKMNMIMHGDGHGGVYHHDGFLNIGGIFEERFDIILTNPPFGSNVEPSDIILKSDVEVSNELEKKYITDLGNSYLAGQGRVKAAIGKPITSLFELPKNQNAKIKTEVLFIERCLSLLKPGGRMGIVLPEGIFNNPSLEYVRQFCEDRAFIVAVVSLPTETFISSGASVKSSLLFLKKFNTEEAELYNQLKISSKEEIEEKYNSTIKTLKNIIDQPLAKSLDFLIDAKNSTPEQKLAAKEAAKLKNLELKDRKKDAKKQLKELIDIINLESRSKLKKDFSYTIFLYEAEKVGISSTGETDLNELYPNKNIPKEIDKTCLELFNQYKEDPTPFLLGNSEV